MKKLTIILFLLSSTLLFSDPLPVIVDLNRFLDETSNTIFDINYQLPYNSLSYVKTETGFTAALKVDYTLAKDGQIVDQGDFTNRLIFPNQEMTRSGKLFRDKLSVTLPSSVYTMHISFTDINTSFHTSWSEQLIILRRDAFISEMEFSSLIVADTTGYLEKFHRDDLLFFVNCNHIYTKGEVDSLYLYYELGNMQFPVGTITEEINIIKDDDTLQVITNELNCRGGIVPQKRKIDISELSEGYHEIIFEFTDPISNVQISREDYFSIRKKSVSHYRLFVDLESEFTLLKYFLPSSKTKIWTELSDDGKLKFLDRFWEANDTDTSPEKNEYFELIRTRVRYSNEHFSYFKDGWDTDRGRIYIKHGKPDDILNGDTDIRTKYAQKKYEIWKYRIDSNYTFLFLDFQTNQNYKLIYSDNDPGESTSSQLEDYLGEEFDLGLLD
ncbi:MAG: GWxTD domain-containing protein [Spirochaetaceae bacterium]|jgi:GWxTD domain-containing protein|nr:GWxTD domain-containing protein [Spirochaetaceae bacterium]